MIVAALTLLTTAINLVVLFSTDSPVLAQETGDAFLDELKARLDDMGTPWVAGQTWVSAFPPEERRMLLGVLPDQESQEYQRVISSVQPEAAVEYTYPPSIDWRSPQTEPSDRAARSPRPLVGARPHRRMRPACPPFAQHAACHCAE